MSHFFRSPAFWAGLMFGVTAGLVCIDVGIRVGRATAPPFPVLTAEPPTYPGP